MHLNEAKHLCISKHDQKSCSLQKPSVELSFRCTEASSGQNAAVPITSSHVVDPSLGSMLVVDVSVWLTHRLGFFLFFLRWGITDTQGLGFFIAISKAAFLSLPPQVSNRCSTFYTFSCVCVIHVIRFVINTNVVWKVLVISHFTLMKGLARMHKDFSQFLVTIGSGSQLFTGW